MIKNLIEKTRSIRRFHENKPVDVKTLRELVDLARLSASSANLQPLKYMLSNEPQVNQKIFNTLAWAGYLTDWAGPVEGERPPAYIVILGDTTITKSVDMDVGIALQSIRLGAMEKGLGSVIVAKIKRQELIEALDILDHLEIKAVVAMGEAKENVVLEKISSDGAVKYWRGEDGVHHVPKRTLDEIIIELNSA